ncbi:carbohydrate ABC transporter permease [Cellulomonas citrea]|uniref:carbohydrate ABC transporter permease n=1 Tax=Cellulomonas citrea TaxID=1909423 RepID=UPI00135BAA39|nr:carbohydrate ABC transporter permease [Cellulomonas citrea]
MTTTEHVNLLAPPRRRGASVSVGRWLTSLVLLVVAGIALGPILYMVKASVTPSDGRGVTFEAWTHVLAQGLARAGANSLVLCVLAIVGVSLFATPAAFAIAKLPFRGSQTILATLTILMLVPGQTSLLPLYFDISRLGLIGNVPMTALLYAVGQLPFATFLLTSFFRSVPSELVEAAVMDGAGYPRIIRSVVGPLAVPPLVTLGVLTFIGVWNDLLFAMLFLPDGAQRTISVVIATAGSTQVFDVTQQMAGALISALPCILVYLIFQRQLAVGLTAGVGK